MSARRWTNWDAFARHQRRRGRAADMAMREAAEVGAEITTKVSKGILERKVYAVPVKKVRARRRPRRWKPKWTRTRQLIDREEFYADRHDIRHRNPTPYAIHRYNLGLEGHRQPIKPTKSVQWWTEAAELSKKAVDLVREDYLKQAMERPEDF